MGADSNIEWTDHTFNPWRGCTKVSPGCANCYAEKLSKRNPGVLGVWGPKGRRVVAAESYWRQPFKWNREAAEAGERRRVFCASLADVFEGPESMRAEDWPAVVQARARLLWLIGATPHLDWLLLTKRPEGVLERLSELQRNDSNSEWGDENESLSTAIAELWRSGDPPENVWLGTSVENQRAADERIPHLLRTPAAVRFLSCEPLLGPVQFCDLPDVHHPKSFRVNALTGRRMLRSEVFIGTSEKRYEPRIDWVICGGESGPRARPMHPDWVRSLRDQCQAADVPFFFKQWGEWAPRENDPRGLDAVKGLENIKHHEEFHERSSSLGWVGGITTGPAQHVVRVGKRAAGRTLDGVTHDAVPAGFGQKAEAQP